MARSAPGFAFQRLTLGIQRRDGEGKAIRLEAKSDQGPFFWIAFAEAGEVNHALAYDISAGIVRLSPGNS